MKLSPQKAIRANCKQCIYDPAEKGNWIEQVEACAITQCAFYEHRPLTAKTRQIQRENKLALLTPCQREIVETTRLSRIKNIENLQARGLFQSKKQETVS